MAIPKKAKEIAAINTNIISLYKQETDLKNEIQNADEQIAINKNVLITSTNPAEIATANTNITVYGELRLEKKNKLKTISSDLYNARWKLGKLTGTLTNAAAPGANLPPLPSLVTNSSTDTSLGISLNWQYNPPMVKAAYLAPRGLQQQDGTMPVGNPGNWDDAYKAWRYSVGSKGVIQMSKDYPYQNKTEKIGDTDVAIRLTEDATVYGFKFLYNPTTVGMQWGVGTEVDIAKFTAGAFKAKPITDAAMNSVITFSVVLNRMLDMNVVTEDGQIIGDPYPLGFTVSQEDAKEIYKKGTMLDLEYLFRAVNGTNSDYNSSLNGMTADLGWLNSFPVELHLGSGLRYLVRVTNIGVNHTIFNERMVPIFSTVDFVCKRLPDLPSSEDNARQTRTAAGASGGMNFL